MDLDVTLEELYSGEFIEVTRMSCDCKVANEIL